MNLKVGDKVETTNYWNVYPTYGIVVRIIGDLVTINWPEGVKSRGTENWFVEPNDVYTIRNPRCYQKMKENKMPEQTVAGVRLSKANQEKLIQAAREAAENLGFCDETENVLREMGFNVEPKTQKFRVTVWFNVDMPVGSDEYPLDEAIESIQSTFDKVIILDQKGAFDDWDYDAR